MSIPLSTGQFEQKKAIRTMPIRRVRTDKVVPTQQWHDPNKVASMAAKSEDGITTVPIAGKLEGRYHVIDGHHRVAAAIARGDRYVNIRVPK